jgi:malonate transporter and related proteins
MAVATIVLPVFALIALGYAGVRFRYLSDAAQKGLTEFSGAVAIPALLFRTVATSATPSVSPLKIWFAYFGAAAVIWLIATLMTRVVLQRPVGDSASIAMTSAYGNSVMLGIPLCVSLYGDAAIPPMAAILAFTSPTYWAVATLHHQAAIAARDQRTAQLLLGVARDLARNPLIVAILCGTLVRITGLPLPTVLDRTLQLLGQAGVPTALVALGVGLVGFAIKGQGPTLAMVLTLKLLVMPLVALALVWGLGLPPAAAGVVLIFAAAPTGANAFLFASKVDRAVNSSSGAVALGTMLSLVTMSVIVAWLT